MNVEPFYLRPIVAEINRNIDEYLDTFRVFQRRALYGICTSGRGEVNNTEVIAPYFFDANGEGIFVGPDDAYDFILYHRANGISLGTPTGGAFGNGNQNIVSLNAQMSLTIYYNQKVVCLSPDEIALMIMQKIIGPATLQFVKGLTSTLLSVSFDKETIFAGEYKALHNSLSAEQQLLRINYQLEGTFRKNCIDICETEDIIIQPPPVISDVQAVPSINGTTEITWMTDILSDSMVDYGTSPLSLISNASDAALVTSHNITLTGLTLGATYYYRVTSKYGSSLPAVFPQPPAAPLQFIMPPPIDPNILHDSTFTAPDGTNILAYVPDVGNPWVIQQGDYEIIGNQAVPKLPIGPGNASVIVTQLLDTTLDYTVRIKCTITDVGAYLGVYARYGGGGGLLILVLHSSIYGVDFAGGGTNFVGLGFASSTAERTFLFRFHGNLMDTVIDGVVIDVDRPFNAANVGDNCGISQHNIATVGTTVNRFEVLKIVT